MVAKLLLHLTVALALVTTFDTRRAAFANGVAADNAAHAPKATIDGMGALDASAYLSKGQFSAGSNSVSPPSFARIPALTTLCNSTGVTAKVESCLLTSQMAQAQSGVNLISNGTGVDGRTSGSKRADSISVLDFGAKQDGVTDDGPSFNAAIKYASEIGGGVVHIPRGPAYAIKTPIIMQHDVTLEGECTGGLGSGTYYTCGGLRAMANMSAIITQADIGAILYDVSLRNIMIDGNDANFKVKNLIDISAVGAYVINVHVDNGSGNCINFRANNAAPIPATWINWIENSQIALCKEVGLLFAGSDSKIVKNQITGNGTGVILEGPGSVMFAENQVENSVHYGLIIKDKLSPTPVAIADYMIIGNSFNQNNGAGVASNGDYGDIFFTTDGTSASATTYCGSTVMGNLFFGTFGTNISVDTGCAGGLITGNSFSSIGQSDDPATNIKFGSYPAVTTGGAYATGIAFAIGGHFNPSQGKTFALSGPGVPTGTTAIYENGRLTASANVTVKTGEILTLEETTGSGFWRIGPNVYGLSATARFKNIPSDVQIDAGGGIGGNSPARIAMPQNDPAVAFGFAASGDTLAAQDNQDNIMALPKEPIAILTFQLPTCSGAYNGKTTRISTSQTITRATVTALGGIPVFGQPPSPMPANSGAQYYCMSNSQVSASWFRQGQ